MLTRLVTTPIRNVVLREFRRNIGVTAACCQAAAPSAAAVHDPIQKLFLEKVKEYAKKSQAKGSGLLDAAPEAEKQLVDELDKIARIYGATDQDMTQFPSFNFKDVPLQPVGVDVDVKVLEEKAVETTEAEEDEDKPYFDF